MLSIKCMLMVGLGGFIGSVLRYLMGLWTHSLSNATSFPVGTSAVNIAGCFLIALLIAPLKGQEAKLFVITGILGSFTTFSTFGYETMAYLRDNRPTMAVANAATNLTLGLGAIWLGFLCSRVLWGEPAS